MGKAMFYHMTDDPLEVTARNLLSRAIEQGLAVAVRGRDPAHLDWLNKVLWLGEKGAFLPHGLAEDPYAADQPVLLTTAPVAPNNARIVMLVDRSEAEPAEVALLERLWVMFDGNDPDSVSHARKQWKSMVAAGVLAEYWAQEGGRWTCKAKSGNGIA